MSTPTPLSPAQPAPTIDALHRDIAFANSYRLELIKLLMTLSAALLAFTVTFRPELKQVLWPKAMWLGWFGLAISMFGGVIHMYGWDRYYMTYRDYDHKHRDIMPPIDGRNLGKRKRAEINRWRRLAMYCQFGGFVIGVAGVAVFAAVNVDGKRPNEQATSPEASLQHKPAPVTIQGKK
jgi:hypothetical protein